MVQHCMDGGILYFKTLMIVAGGKNNRVKEKTLGLYDDTLTELNRQKTVLDEKAFGGKGTPELVYVNLGDSLETVKKALHSHFVFLIGERDDTRVQQAGKLLSRKLKPGSYPILFTLQTGSGYEVHRPLSPWECWGKYRGRLHTKVYPGDFGLGHFPESYWLRLGGHILGNRWEALQVDRIRIRYH